jgi:hypothetical protein
LALFNSPSTDVHPDDPTKLKSAPIPDEVVRGLKGEK